MLKFSSILDLIRAFPNEESCIKYLENLRWKNGVVSPFDSTSQVYSCKNNRYKCKNTGKYFTVKIRTIFEGSKVSFQNWFIAIYLYTSHKRGISSYQLARDLAVTQKTAYFILQRLRHATEQELRQFKGIVQCDETFVGGKNRNRHKDKKVAQSQGRSFKDKTPVFGVIEKSTGLVKAIVVKDTKAKTIQPLLKQHIKSGSHVMTDEWHAYKNIGGYYKHTFVDHGRKQYANEDTTTNAIECYWSHLKRSIIGVYYKTSRKHLQLYVNESTFRYNTKQMKTSDRFDLFLQTTENKRLTWQNLKVAS